MSLSPYDDPRIEPSPPPPSVPCEYCERSVMSLCLECEFRRVNPMPSGPPQQQPYAKPVAGFPRKHKKYGSRASPDNKRRKGAGNEQTGRSPGKEGSAPQVPAATVDTLPEDRDMQERRSPINSAVFGAGRPGAAAVPSNIAVIDGSNLACAIDNNPGWPALPAGIVEGIKYFRNKGMEAVAILPKGFVENIEEESDDAYEEFQGLLENGSIVIVPPENTEADDDAFLLKYALQSNGCIISNDRFQDRTENARVALGMTKQELLDHLRQCLVPYSFHLGEFIPDPESPLISELSSKTGQEAEA